VRARASEGETERESFSEERQTERERARARARERQREGERETHQSEREREGVIAQTNRQGSFAKESHKNRALLQKKVTKTRLFWRESLLKQIVGYVQGMASALNKQGSFGKAPIHTHRALLQIYFGFDYGVPRKGWTAHIMRSHKNTALLQKKVTKTGLFCKRKSQKQGSFAKESHKNRTLLQKKVTKTGLFCKRHLSKQGSFAKETCEHCLCCLRPSLGGLPLFVLGTVPRHMGARLI